jgi:hypothetical protein
MTNKHEVTKWPPEGVVVVVAVVVVVVVVVSTLVIVLAVAAKVKVKLNLEQAKRAQGLNYRYSSTLSLTSALDGMGGQRHTPPALPPRKRPGTHCRETEWFPGQVWTGAENISPTGIRSPDRPALSESLHRPHRPTLAVAVVVLQPTEIGVQHQLHYFLWSTYDMFIHFSQCEWYDFEHGLVQFVLVHCLFIRVFFEHISLGLPQHLYIVPTQTAVLWVTPTRKSDWPSLLPITQIIKQ